MSDEAARGGLFIPYPLLGIMLTLCLVLAGGIIGLYSQVSAMNTTMILRDQTYSQQVKELKEKTDLQGLLISDMREKVIRLEERKKGGG